MQKLLRYSALLFVMMISALVLFMSTSNSAKADHAADQKLSTPGCYVDTGTGIGKTTCPTDEKDTNNDSLDGAKNCYYKTTFGSGGNARWVHVECGKPPSPDTIAQSDPDGSGASSAGEQELYGWLLKIINLLSALIGLVIVISIIIAGIQYMTAGGNASQVSAAKNRIAMAVLSLFLFAFAFVLLQWLVPGGVF